MYRRPKFLEVLLKIRQDMSRQADYDVDLFAEMIRSGRFAERKNGYDFGETDKSDRLDKPKKEKSSKTKN